VWLAVACCLALFILKCCRRSSHRKRNATACYSSSVVCFRWTFLHRIGHAYVYISRYFKHRSIHIMIHTEFSRLIWLVLTFSCGIQVQVTQCMVCMISWFGKVRCPARGELKERFPKLCYCSHCPWWPWFQRLFHFGLRKNDTGLITPKMRSRSNSAMMIWWD